MTQGVYNEPKIILAHTQVILLHKHQCLIGASAASPTLVVKTENCLYVYIYICIYICLVRAYSVYVYILPHLCAMQYFHIVHVTTVAQD